MKTFVGLVLAASWLLRSCVTDDTDLTDTRAPVFGCERAAAAVHSPRPPSRIRVGVTGVIAEAGQYLAEAEGHFAEQGLRVQFINFTAPSRMVPALAAGQLEVGSGSIGPGLLNASEGDMCVKIVGSLSREEVNANGVFLFARRELIDSGRLRDYPDLKSLHIAVPGRDNTSEYALAKLLSAGGLSLSDVRLVQMGYPGILVGLANKSLDAAILPEALATSAADKNLGVKWKPVADVVPGAQFGVVLFSPQFAAQRDMAVRWMSAYLEGVRDYNDAFFHNVRRTEIVSRLVAVSPVKDARLYDQMGFTLIDPDGKVNMTSVEDQMQWFVHAGELPQTVDLAKITDTSFAQEAVRRLGVYN